MYLRVNTHKQRNDKQKAKEIMQLFPSAPRNRIG